MGGMSSAPSPDEIARDATWLAQALDPNAGMVRLVAMDREAYRQASFLDDRMFQRPTNAQLVPWDVGAEAATLIERDDARWIFHIGHVGSTLGSRLLGELEGVLAVREPRMLRDLALSPPEIRARFVGPVTQLMSRTFSVDEAACIKATSFVSEIAADLVPPGQRALFMYTTPDAYIATILAGENSLKELEALAPSRTKRMAARMPLLTDAASSAAHAAAAAWACEMTALEAAAEAMIDRKLLWADFEVVLDDLSGSLIQAARFFGFDASDAEVRAVASGPLLNRYSKAPEHGYSRELRNALLGQASHRFRGDIAAALAMLERAAEKTPLLARALGRTGIGS
jgi:hypothetical protein